MIMKRLIALTLVLVLCFALLTMAASASKLTDLAETAGGVFTTLKAFGDTFGLPPAIQQLFDIIRGNKFGGLIESVLGLFRAFAG